MAKPVMAASDGPADDDAEPRGDAMPDDELGWKGDCGTAGGGEPRVCRGDKDPSGANTGAAAAAAGVPSALRAEPVRQRSRCACSVCKMVSVPAVRARARQPRRGREWGRGGEKGSGARSGLAGGMGVEEGEGLRRPVR